MTDDQLKDLEGKMFSDACSPKAEINDILLTLNYFMFFDKNDIYFYDNNYSNQLINALQDAVTRSFDSNKSLYIYDPVEFNFQYSALVNDAETLSRIRDILNSAKDKNHRLETQNLVKAIFNNDTDKIRNITQSGIKINIFKELLESNYLNNALLEPKFKAALLDNYLNSEYLQISNSHDFHHGEQSDISKLIEKIENYTQTDNSIGQIDRFNLNNLVKTLKDILTKFKQ